MVERHLQQFPDGADFDHEGVELGQPLSRESTPALRRWTTRNVIKKPFDFAQSQPHELGEPHDSQTLENLWLVSALTADPWGAGQEADFLIVSNCRCAQTGAAGDLADAQIRHQEAP